MNILPKDQNELLKCSVHNQKHQVTINFLKTMFTEPLTFKKYKS